MRSCEKIIFGRGWQAKPRNPPLWANELGLVAQAVSPAYYLVSWILRGVVGIIVFSRAS
jgi:hypothetical protein